ncbi:shikimate kinase [Neptunitalea chrysea]|uniref:Shikimate kinase n=1 Tax=Neptunitalea chrysea TaxID=1647581 RepID=A0A9W6B468_9FLAO|nr:shikimate kinase [Neptunitalea chrysea]GLB52239.1 shikimate kinase [Neptunitalea chrysea]
MIILLGYMGSGKSAVGKSLAVKLNQPFLDFDEYIEQKEGISVTTIFQEKGEIYFRKIEHLYLKELLDENRNMVLSLGGGTPCYSNNIALLLKATPHVFYLNVGIGTLVERLLKEKSHRPVIAHLTEENLPEFIGKHLFERNSFYQQAHHHVNANKKTIEELVNEIGALI